MNDMSTLTLEKAKRSSFDDVFYHIFPVHIRHNAVKRTFDLCFSASLTIALLPLYCLIALIVGLTSRGPIIYGHKRVGRGGKAFNCYKFRTMYKDADERLKLILQENPHLNQEWKKSRKLQNDPRVTPIGSFLRKTSLDELPQFWNVLKGDLSVTGPRPVVEEEVRLHLGLKAAKILSIRPGITGIWQTSGRSSISYEQRIALDEKYVDEHTLWMDIKLVLKTIPCMIFSKGAY